jgi:hypothetical protein
MHLSNACYFGVLIDFVLHGQNFIDILMINTVDIVACSQSLDILQKLWSKSFLAVGRVCILFSQ